MLTDIKYVKVENSAELCQFSFLFSIFYFSISDIMECKQKNIPNYVRNKFIKHK